MFYTHTHTHTAACTRVLDLRAAAVVQLFSVRTRARVRDSNIAHSIYALYHLTRA